MAKLGTNVKMTTAAQHKEATRKVFEEVLGCARQSPNDSIDLFALADGASIAVDYVAPEKALSPEQLKNAGTWIELEVDDEETTAKALEGCEGVSFFSFVTEHRYFQLPGGQVVRIKR